MYSNDFIHDIQRVISIPRFKTYLDNTEQDVSKAVCLYEFNALLSSAFMLPLHVFEIAIRNAVVEALRYKYGMRWYCNQSFLKSLPRNKKGYCPFTNLVVLNNKFDTEGKIIAELKFYFWQIMFTSRFHQRLWHKQIKIIFPNTPTNISEAEMRETVYTNLNIIRNLRNRIAHHEPIFLRSSLNDYVIIKNTIYFRSLEFSNWLDKIQTVIQIIGMKP